MAIRGKQEERKGYCRKGIFNEMGQREWLERVGKRCGFEASAVIISPRGTLEGRKPSSVPNDRTHVISCYMADFDGVLRISDVEQFETAYSQGVGRGKAWGCGLLSLGRA
jgi:CRISPR system Cascade subunit CasE